MISLGLSTFSETPTIIATWHGFREFREMLAPQVVVLDLGKLLTLDEWQRNPHRSPGWPFVHLT